jgi:uncharacterized protein YbjT (DUF2867 family)
MRDQQILVTGATGRQGGAAARHLLGDGWRVRALVRDPTAPAALALRKTGAELVRGNLEDRASLDAALDGVYGVFSVQPFGYDDEIRRGVNVADAALAAGVQHIVYSSVGDAEAHARRRPNFSKWAIEQHLRGRDAPLTILRPNGFMEDMIGPAFGVPDGTFTSAFGPDVLVYLVAVDDIGVFAARAFAQPDTYLGAAIELAGDALTPPQIAAAIGRVVGRPLPVVQIPLTALREQNEDVARAYEVVNAGGYQIDIAALRRQHPGLMDFDTWLAAAGKALLSSAG